MHTILDLDLDFFVWPPFRHEPESQRLPASECRHLASRTQVRAFMEGKCCLSTQEPLPGYEAEAHVNAFKVWARWIEDNRLSVPFDVVHVDAHSDLGSGENQSCWFIERELLALPVDERGHPIFGPDHLNSGNYLLGAIANRWIAHLTYVYPVDPNPPTSFISGEPITPVESMMRIEDTMMRIQKSFYREDPPVFDLPAWIFRENDWHTNVIELKHCRGDQSCLCNEPPLRIEPPVPLQLKASSDFCFSGFTHVFLAHSPEHTPVEADELLPVIREYIQQI
jgi:hypothetical protein